MSLKSFASGTCIHAGRGAVRYLLRNHQVGAASAALVRPSSSSSSSSSFLDHDVSRSSSSSNIMMTTRRHYSATLLRRDEDQQQQQQEKEALLRRNDPNVLIPPSMDIAKNMACGLSQMDNTTLTTIAALGHHDAGCEVLKRHIMVVDNVSYEDACIKFVEIEQSNRGFLNIEVFPYVVGISLGLVGAFGALPMVFDLNTALWFNEGYVTTDIPEPRDLETKLEVGSWTWNWMEPPLGTFSFVLLCLQYARAQIQNLGLQPYTSLVRRRRADRLVAHYPQYSAEVLKQYSTSDPLMG